MLRIKSTDNFNATVRWKGQLPDNKGILDDWFGVEWDDPSRGKHDGEFRGEQLFKVSKPKSGSFVRQKAVVIGVSISDIISDYTFVGGFLSLDNTNVCSVGNIISLPSSIKVINVSHSLVGSFEFIWELLRVGPSVETLLLGQLHFAEFPPPPTTYNLKSVVMNNTNIQEEHIPLIFTAFPSLNTLDISFTIIRDYSIIKNHHSLTEVVLNGLSISSFESLSDTVGLLPNLEILTVNNNELAEIKYKKDTFLKLKVLNINSNRIESLFGLSDITLFPSLVELRVQRNPIQEILGEIEARMLTIARFPSILKLNGSTIDDSERRNSEIQYLTFFANDVYQNGNDNHPRWIELVDKYGPPVVTCVPKEAPKPLEVTFEFEDQEINQSLMPSMTVEMVQLLASQMFGVISEDINIYMEYNEYKTKLSYPDNTLEDIGCISGAKFTIKMSDEDYIDEKQIARNFRLRSITAHVKGSE